MIALLASPERYDGKPVSVFGYAHFEFEGNMLCSSRDAFEDNLISDCVWLDVPSGSGFRDFSNRIVMVVGIYRAHQRGHEDMFSGSLTSLSTFAAWPSRKEVREFAGGRP